MQRLFRKYHNTEGPRMFEGVWALLKMYTVVVNYKLQQRGLPTQNQFEVMGAICSRFLLAMRSRIVDDYQAIVTERVAKSLYPKLTAGDRAALATEFPDVYAADGGGQGEPAGAGEDEEAGRPIFWNAWGPDPIASGLRRSSRKVRGGNARPARAAGVWDQIRRALVDERAPSAEPSDVRLLPDSAETEAGDAPDARASDVEGGTQG